MNLLNIPSKPLYVGEFWWIADELIVMVPERPLKWEPAQVLRDFERAFITRPGTNPKDDQNHFQVFAFYPADDARLHPVELMNRYGEIIQANLAVCTWADDWFTNTDLIPRVDAWAK